MKKMLDKDAMKQLNSVNRNLVDRVYEIKQPNQLSCDIDFFNLATYGHSMVQHLIIIISQMDKNSCNLGYLC